MNLKNYQKISLVEAVCIGKLILTSTHNNYPLSFANHKWCLDRYWSSGEDKSQTEWSEGIGKGAQIKPVIIIPYNP